MRTQEGREHAVELTLYPLEDDDSSVELEAECRVEQAGPNACLISAGAWVRILPSRVELADRPADGFAIDATRWHKYRIVSSAGRLRVFVDGEARLDASTDKVFTRLVRFGNRSGLFGAVPEAKPGKLDRLRYAVLGSDRYDGGTSLTGTRFLKVTLTDFDVNP